MEVYLQYPIPILTQGFKDHSTAHRLGFYINPTTMPTKTAILFEGGSRSFHIRLGKAGLRRIVEGFGGFRIWGFFGGSKGWGPGFIGFFRNGT